MKPIPGPSADGRRVLLEGYRPPAGGPPLVLAVELDGAGDIIGLVPCWPRPSRRGFYPLSRRALARVGFDWRDAEEWAVEALEGHLRREAASAWGLAKGELQWN